MVPLRTRLLPTPVAAAVHGIFLASTLAALACNGLAAYCPATYAPAQVEATKFTEVGFHGRDVDQIIRDLVDNAIIMMRQVGGN